MAIRPESEVLLVLTFRKPFEVSRDRSYARMLGPAAQVLGWHGVELERLSDAYRTLQVPSRNRQE